MSIPSSLLTRARAAARPQVTGSVTGAMGLTLTVDGSPPRSATSSRSTPATAGCWPRSSPSAATG